VAMSDLAWLAALAALFIATVAYAALCEHA
jgi:hypothetical protein